MKTFGTLDARDYTVEKFYAGTQIDWRLTSSSQGMALVDYPELVGAVDIFFGENTPLTEAINVSTNTNTYVQYRSVKHLFYNNMAFFNGSGFSTNSLAPLADRSYIVSIGQEFYGDRIKPGSFEFSIDGITEKVQDDIYGNLYVSQSGTGSYVGNVFYGHGIAVITENSSSAVSDVSAQGIKIVSGSQVTVTYHSDIKTVRHQVNVKLKPSDFNYSMFNPSMQKSFTTTGSVTQSLIEAGVPESGSNTWTLSNLMAANIIKPYVTTIGLYNDKYELLATAKLSTPIQRTFDMDQIFIVRFDTE